MQPTTELFKDLVKEFGNLPGIGRKTAERLAYHVLCGPKDEALRLSTAIRRVVEGLRNCQECFNVAEERLCPVCQDEGRDRSLICVVEGPRDLLAIEASGSYHGLYHVLQGAFAPLDGVSPDDLTLDALARRVQRGGVREIIVATNPDFAGDGTALLVRERVAKLDPELRLTRIARGVPSGSHLEHVSRTMLADALEGRRELEG